MSTLVELGEAVQAAAPVQAMLGALRHKTVRRAAAARVIIQEPQAAPLGRIPSTQTQAAREARLPMAQLAVRVRITLHHHFHSRDHMDRVAVAVHPPRAL